ncbi:MAG: hypothetical protein K1X67_06300 [Fimbriimonadaceae bacterium]|nr:hypothetical protein [Fimbriimonadaceae bacterium]
MTSSTDTKTVIVLGDKDTGSRLEMLESRAAECGVSITETHTFEGSEAAQQDNVADIAAAFTALCHAVRTQTNIWLPFPLDLIREEHARRLSLVLQRHGLELLIGRAMWSCPRDSGVSEIDGALRREVRAVDDLDRALLAALGGLTLTDEIESMLRADAAGPVVEHPGEQMLDVLQRLEIQYGPHPGLPSTRAAWAVRLQGLKLFARWLVNECEMTRPQAAGFLNALGHRTRSGRSWQRSSLSSLVSANATGQSAV